MPDIDPEKFAEGAGLRYVTDDQPGYYRKRWGRGFLYVDEKEKKVTSERILKRIKDLVIPPAWEKVWICKHSTGHIQATGYDQKGRKQYLYHEEWNKLRNERKYDEMIEFAKCLPTIRKRMEADLRKRGLKRERILAAIVYLMQEGLIRIGNRSYAEQNNSYGLTTLRRRHLEINGSSIELEFKAKSGKMQKISLKNPRLARIIKQCSELPGYEIFKFVDEDGHRQSINSEDVNAYLREITGKNFTAKYFRTWGGSVKALEEYEQILQEDLGKKKLHVQVVKRVAERLNNTVGICRDYYIHPAVMNIIKEGKPVKISSAKIVEEELTPAEHYFLQIVRSEKRRRGK